MNALLSSVVNLPRPLQVVGLLLAGPAITASVIFAWGGQTLIAVIILGGLVSIALLLLIYRAILAWRAKAKANPFIRDLAGSGAAVPKGAGDAATRARLDDLRKKFDTGMATFKRYGKNLYSLPWYLIVGEPGSGKTELIRHSNIGFPPGLQDELQGVGGTVNMDWWFTDQAVVLDTAGRLILEEVDASGTSEWKEFLKLLARHRPNCPVNGLLLAIPADSLIKDSADVIERKAGKIARQLDNIQRTLGVRFPVSIIITKADLVNGFREFFEDLNDPQQQHQMFGWSNPAPLDEEFKPEHVERHLDQVRTRMIRRRLALLRDPVHTENQSARRVDQVDSLFAFPDSLAGLAPRLRRYLELIFVGGTWATKPLFLRGIYFASSMTEGVELDEELAKLYGVTIESLPGGRDAGFKRDKAYFIRDLFLSKVFRERGLVTRAGNTRSLQRRRQALLLGTGFAGLVIIGAMTLYGALSLNSSVLDPKRFWSAASALHHGDANRLLVVGTGRSDDVEYLGAAALDHEEFFPSQPGTVVRAMRRAFDEAREEINVPWIFRLIEWDDDLLDRQRHEALSAIVVDKAIEPLVRWTRTGLAGERDRGAAQWDSKAAAALAELLRLETAAASGQRSATPLRLEPLFDYVLSRAEQRQSGRAAPASTEPAAHARRPAPDDIAALQEIVEWLYGTTGRNQIDWPVPALAAATVDSRRVVSDSINSFAAACAQRLKGLRDPDVRALEESLAQLQSAEAQLHALQQNFDSVDPGAARNWTGDQDTAVRGRYHDVVASAQAVRAALASERLKSLGTRPLRAINDELVAEQLKLLQQQRDALREAHAPLALAPDGQITGSLRADAGDQAEFLKPIIDRIEKMSVSVEEADKAARDKALNDLDAMHLAMAGSAGDQRRFELRLHMYALAHEQLTRQSISAQDKWQFDMARHMGRIEEEIEAARRQVELDAAQLPKLPTAGLNENARSVSLAGLAMAARIQRQAFADNFFARMPATLQQIEEALAAATSSADLVKFPAIELTSLAREEDVAPRYTVAVARDFFDSWRMVDERLNAPQPARDESRSPAASEQSFIDAARVRKAFDAGRPHVKSYADAYQRYWVVQVRDKATPVFPADQYKDWPQVTNALLVLSVQGVNANLSSLLRLMGEALDAVPPALHGPELKAQRELVSREIAAFGSDLNRRAGELLEPWLQPSSLESARVAILSDAASSRKLQPYFYGLRHVSDEPVRYWSQLSIALLAKVGDLYQEQSRQALQSLQQTRNRFPLCRPNPQQPVEELSASEFDAAVTRIQQCAASGQPADQRASPAMEFWNQDPDVGPQLRRLLNPELPAHDRAWLNAISGFPLAYASSGRNMTCQIFAVRQPDALGRAEALAVERYRRFSVAVDGRESRIEETKHAAATEIRGAPAITIPCKAESFVELRFYSDFDIDAGAVREGREPNGLCKLPAPWTVLGPYLADDIAAAEREGELWIVPVQVVDLKNQSEKSLYWIGLKFTAPSMPAPDDWPRCGAAFPR